MGIPDMVRGITERTPGPNPDGGIGGLTAGEERELDDLLNGPHKACACGGDGTCACGRPSDARAARGR